MIGNKIANEIMGVSKYLQQNNPQAVTNEHDKEIPKERYVSPRETQEIIDELRLKQHNEGISKNNKNFKKFSTK